MHLQAAGTEIALGEIKAVVTLPEGWTRTQGDALLQAETPEGAALRVNYSQGKISEDHWNYSLFDDDECLKLGAQLVQRLEKAGYTGVECRLVPGDSIKWLVLDWNKADPALYGCQYYTVVNGLAVSMDLTSPSALDHGELQALEEMARGFRFLEILERPSRTDTQWKKTFLWIAGLLAAAGLTYLITSVRRKRG